VLSWRTAGLKGGAGGEALNHLTYPKMDYGDFLRDISIWKERFQKRNGVCFTDFALAG
jgi:hypothetical protein